MAKQDNMNKGKKPFYKKWWVWLLAIIVIGSMANAGEETTETVTETPVEETQAQEPTETTPEPTETTEAPEETPEEPVEEVAPVEEEPAEPEMSVSQENAIKKAQSYLDFTAFSRTGLIEQLEFDGFPTDEATFAVDNVEVDWNEQAGLKAQSYLDFSSFSRQGLIEQLEFDGFTPEQAEYGVSQVGL